MIDASASADTGAARSTASGPVSHPESGRIGTAGRIAVFLALGALVAVLPRFLFPFVVPRALWFRAAVAIGGVAMFTLWARRGLEFRGRMDSVLWALLAYLAVQAISAATGVAPVHSFFGDLERMGGVWTFVHLVLLYVLARTFLAERDWTLVFRLTSLLVCFIVFTAVLETQPNPFFNGVQSRPGGILGNPGYLATLLIATAPAPWLAWRRTAGVWRHAHLGALAVYLTGFGLAQTRGAMVGVLAGLALFAVTAPVRTGRLHRLLALAGVIVVLGGGLLWVRWLPSGEGLRSIDLVERVARTGASESGVSVRLLFWEAALEAGAERPLLGYGPENEGIGIGHYQDPVLTRMNPGGRADRSHNVFLDMWSSMGVAGVLAYLALWAAFFWSVWRTVRERTIDATAGALIASVLLAYLVTQLFWFPELTGWIALLLLMAWVGSSRLGPLAAPRRESRPQRAFVLVAGVVAVVLVAWAQIFLPARQSMLIRSASGTPGITLDRKLDLLDTAIASSATQQFQGLVRHVAEVQRTVEDPQARASLPVLIRVAESIALGKSAMARELSRDPLNDLLWARSGVYHLADWRIRGDAAQLDSATAAIRRAVDLAPGRIRHRHLLSQAYLVADRPDEAEAELRATLDVYDEFGETHQLMGLVALRKGDIDEGAEWLTRSLMLGDPPGATRPYATVVDSMVAGGRFAEAAGLASAWATARMGDPVTTRRFPVHGVGGLGRAEAQLLNRIPVLWLRAGDDRRAVLWAAHLVSALPDVARSARPFFDWFRTREEAAEWPDEGVVSDEALLAALLLHGSRQTG